MYKIENPMYEIGLILENYFEKEKAESIGNNVYEISLLISEWKESREK